MEEINCIFCNKNNDQIIIKENGYVGRKCSKCGLIYISPRPSPADIKDLYINDAANISAISHISAEYVKRLYARHNLKIIQKYIKTGNLLEIGAGSGFFLDEAKKVGFQSYGIELNPIQSGFIRDELKIPCEESPINKSTFDGMIFDIIYHCDVLSHFHDPIYEFEKMHEIMNEDAFLIFETGNIGDVKEKDLKYFQNFQYPDHLFFFGNKNLKDLCEKTGFKILKIYRYSILPELILNKILIRRFSNPSKNAIPPGDSPDNSEIISKISTFKTITRNSFNYWNYVLRYKIGKFLPKKFSPQTLIIIAQKKNATKFD